MSGICLEQQDTVGNKLLAIYTICKKERDQGHIDDQVFVLIAKHIKEIETCKFMESKKN